MRTNPNFPALAAWLAYELVNASSTSTPPTVDIT